jgi:hypothetical protein
MGEKVDDELAAFGGTEMQAQGKQARQIPLRVRVSMVPSTVKIRIRPDGGRNGTFRPCGPSTIGNGEYSQTDGIQRVNADGI